MRPNDSGPYSLRIGGSPGRLFDATNVTAEMLITRAYGVRREQLDGGPDWIGAERWDVVARAPDGAAPGERNLRLQSLLEDRFGLVVRRETREDLIYALVVAREGAELGPRLTPTAVDCATIQEQRATARSAGREDTAKPPTECVTVIVALEEQLGLRLQPERGPVEFLVIDAVEHPEPN